MSEVPSNETSFRIKEARIVAAIHGGGAIVEHANLIFTEGRSWEGGSDGSSRLGYHALFEREDADPLASEGVEARIIITGQHECGKAIEIRGDGYFGYDDNGCVEGTFEEPPLILVESESDPTSLKPDGGFGENPPPKPPKQYLDALRQRVDQND